MNRTHTAQLICLFLANVLPAQVDAPLADAVEKRDAATVASLLKQKCDVNAQQADGMTALHWAVYQDDLPMARALIKAGAEVKAQNRYGVAPLSLACANGNGPLVELLLDRGTDPNSTLRGGETALMTAARTGRLGAVRALLAKGAKVDATEARSQTALMWAAAEGHAAVVDALIQAGADFRKPLNSGFTPLFFAVREGRIEVTRRLLAAGVDVNGTMQIVERRGKGPVKGTSPLLLAMENGHFELAAVLLGAGGNPNDTRTGYTPLHALSWIRKPDKGDSDSSVPPPIGSGRLTSLQFAHKLVEAGADVNFRKKDKSGGRRKISTPGTTPFLCAAGTADTAYMKTLLELDADPKLNNAQNQTPLMMAAGIGELPEADGPGTKPEHFEAVQFLLELGAEINAVDNNGETAMHATAYKSLPKVAQLLSDRGADIRIWAKKSKQGRTPLSIAQGYRPGNFKPSFETVAAIEKIMLAQGVTPPLPPKKHGKGYRD